MKAFLLDFLRFFRTTVDKRLAVLVMKMGHDRSQQQKDGEPTWSPATARGLLDMFGKEMGMFVDRKIIGIKRLEDMGDDELRQIAGQVIDELDAQVTVDGEVKQVEAELLGPPGDENTTHNATHDNNEAADANVINELGGETN